jgi:hypothetical protein
VGQAAAGAAKPFTSDVRALRHALARDVVAGWDRFKQNGALILELDVLTVTANRAT